MRKTRVITNAPERKAWDAWFNTIRKEIYQWVKTEKKESEDVFIDRLSQELKEQYSIEIFTNGNRATQFFQIRCRALISKMRVAVSQLNDVQR